jgi:hypothetical protein
MTLYRNGVITPEYAAIRSRLWNADGTRTKEYEESLIKQTRLWMEGTPWHNTLSDECCSDFSCCVPELLTQPIEKRYERGMAELMKWGLHPS